MSGRHTLYGQSLVRSANSLANISGASVSKHWVKSWIKPPKNQNINNASTVFQLPSGISSGETTTSNSTPQPPATPVYEFEVHAWVLTEEIDETKIEVDNDDKEYLDLSQYLYQPGKQGLKEVAPTEKAEALSEADIRGAVGGGDMIGFSNSAAKEMKSLTESTAEVKGEGISTSVEGTPDVELESKSEEIKTDFEGDVKME